MSQTCSSIAQSTESKARLWNPPWMLLNNFCSEKTLSSEMAATQQLKPLSKTTTQNCWVGMMQEPLLHWYLQVWETIWLLSCYTCTVFQESWAVNLCLLVVIKKKWWALAQSICSTWWIVQVPAPAIAFSISNYSNLFSLDRCTKSV